MPVVAATIPANGDEKQQVLPMLNQIRLANGKRRNRLRRPKILAADKGYDGKWLRYKLRTKGMRPQSKKRQGKGKKLRGRLIAETVPRASPVAFFLVASAQIQATCSSPRTPQSVFVCFPPPRLLLYLVSAR